MSSLKSTTSCGFAGNIAVHFHAANARKPAAQEDHQPNSQNDAWRNPRRNTPRARRDQSVLAIRLDLVGRNRHARFRVKNGEVCPKRLARPQESRRGHPLTRRGCYPTVKFREIRVSPGSAGASPTLLSIAANALKKVGNQRSCERVGSTKAHAVAPVARRRRYWLRGCWPDARLGSRTLSEPIDSQADRHQDQGRPRQVASDERRVKKKGNLGFRVRVHGRWICAS